MVLLDLLEFSASHFLKEFFRFFPTDFHSWVDLSCFLLDLFCFGFSILNQFIELMEGFLIKSIFRVFSLI